MRLARCSPALLLAVRAAIAQTDVREEEVTPVATPRTPPPIAAAPVNPWDDRPVCQSAFLNNDFALGGKQRACHWLSHGVFSVGGLTGAALGAGVSVLTDQGAERGEPYGKRFGRRAARNALGATGAFVGAAIAREDPRRRPPYLVLLGARSRGVVARTRRAVSENFMAYRCASPCRDASHVDRYPSLGRAFAAAASGYGGELLVTDRPHSNARALRGALSSYAMGYGSAVIGEFTPEVTSWIAKGVGAIFRGL